MTVPAGRPSGNGSKRVARTGVTRRARAPAARKPYTLRCREEVTTYPLVWIYGIYDAYKTAERLNAAA